MNEIDLNIIFADDCIISTNIVFVRHIAKLAKDGEVNCRQLMIDIDNKLPKDTEDILHKIFYRKDEELISLSEMPQEAREIEIDLRSPISKLGTGLGIQMGKSSFKNIIVYRDEMEKQIILKNIEIDEENNSLIHVEELDSILESKKDRFLLFIASKQKDIDLSIELGIKHELTGTVRVPYGLKYSRKVPNGWENVVDQCYIW